MNKKIIKIIELGTTYTSANLGCSALGYSFLQILEKIARDENLFFNIINISGSEFKYESEYCSVRTFLIDNKNIINYKQYANLIKKDDIVIDFTEGDSFTDIYGIKRFVTLSLRKQIALNKGAKFIMGPQTIGPFHNKYIITWAKEILKKTNKIYVRDELSNDYVESLGFKCTKTTDIAFALKPSNDVFNFNKSNKKKIGLNVSALMMNNGYTKSTSFNLKMNYKNFCNKFVEKFQDNYDIYLIAHVVPENKGVEDDYEACKKLHEKYPNTTIGPLFKTPMEAKKYMSYLDCVVGSRMHATIGAFSMGIPVISISYSRKFQGLYDSIGYKHTIDAKKIDEKTAIDIIEQHFNDLKELKKEADASMIIVKNLNDKFINELKEDILNG